jgi:hypothetical protein
MRRLIAFALGAALATAAGGAEDPSVRALQQHQLQRQQQQEALQLRMQQQQRAAQNPPADLRPQQATELQQVEQQLWQKQEAERLRIDQQQRQQQLQYRQGIEPATAQPSDDDAQRRARAQMELQKAQESSQQQLRRFDSESQPWPGAASEPLRRLK